MRERCAAAVMRLCVPISTGFHVLLLHSAFLMQLQCNWPNAMSVFLSLGSRLLIRGVGGKLGRGGSQQNKEHVQTSAASPVGQRNTDSWLRLKVTMTCLPTGLQHLCKNI